MLTVLKIGGNVLNDETRLEEALSAFSSIPDRKILVHGGGRAATAMAARLGIEATMVEGRRITDDAMLEVVTMVYGGLMNKGLVANLQSRGLNALGLTGADLNVFEAHKRTGTEIDYGWVGDIDRVNTVKLLPLIQADVIPVMAPLTHDGNGTMLNTNADTIASELAVALSADLPVRLVYAFELPGVMIDPNQPDSVIASLDPGTYQQLREEEVISGGMIPKLDNAFAALKAGVSEVVICQAPMVAMLGTDGFVGTVIRL